MFLRFCLVGTLGFFVDSGVLLVVTRTGALGSMAGRVVSFLAAASVTWVLNRRFTFRSRATVKSLLPYVTLTSLGALLNLGIYRIWIAALGEASVTLVTGVAAGSIAALAFNFLISKHVVFQTPLSRRSVSPPQ
jgi:putative flippase GtrA